MKVYGKIEYTMKLGHPDIPYEKNWRPDRVFKFEDTYTVNPDCFSGTDAITTYIAGDLKLVAGGGYDCNHIDVKSIEIREMSA